MSKTFDELLLMYKYNFSQNQIQKIGLFWQKYIKLDDITGLNFLSSKYSLALGDVAEFLISKFTYIEKEFLTRVVPEIKKNNSFYFENNGMAFQYLCYSLFKNYNILVPENETIGKSSTSMDLSIVNSEFELEIKTIQLASLENKFSYLSDIVTKFFMQLDFSGKFYINLTFSNQLVSEALFEKSAEKILILLNELVRKIKNVGYSLLAEDYEIDIDNFCLIKINYQHKKINFNDYRIGRELAGLFCEGNNITKTGGGFYLTTDYISINLEPKIREWCKEKLKNKQGAFFFSVGRSIYDDLSIKNSFIRTKRDTPNLIALFHIDLWDNEKLAKIKAYCEKSEDILKVVNQLDLDKVDVEIIEV